MNIKKQKKADPQKECETKRPKDEEAEPDPEKENRGDSATEKMTNRWTSNPEEEEGRGTEERQREVRDVGDGRRGS